MTFAYLVGLTPPFDLYVQIGENSETAVWENTGPFNAGTLVQSGGAYLNIWNADTKMNKLAGGTSPHVRVLVIEPNNATNYAKARNLVTNASKMAIGAIPAYVAPTDTFKGTIGEAVLVSGAPTKPFHVATKEYVDTAPKGSIIYTHDAVISVNGVEYNIQWLKGYNYVVEEPTFSDLIYGMEGAYAIKVGIYNEDGDIHKVTNTTEVTIWPIEGVPQALTFCFLSEGTTKTFTTNDDVEVINWSVYDGMN